MAKPVSSPKSSPAKGKASAPSTRSSGGRPAGLFTWVAVGLVVVIVAVIVVVKVTSGTTSSGSSAWQATSPSLAAEVTDVAPAVFDAVGVADKAQVTAPLILKKQPELTAKLADGTTVPEILYIGAEYCPYCAAQRWATIAALGRFGTWKGLGNTTSSSTDVYKNTPTFTFARATFTSKYLVFRGVETLDNAYKKLMTPTKQEQAILDKYDTPKYVPGMNPSDVGSIPFISMGNKFLVSGASYNPALLTGLTRDQIAANLSAASSPITQAIITSANDQTAAICTLTMQQPANVCGSSGVLAAKKAMKI